MKKYFAFTDVHSYFSLLQEELNKAGFDINNPEHILISCGDLFDRGEESKELLDWVLSIPEDRIIFVKGNHEDLMEEVFERGYFGSHDIHNGTDKTFYQLSNIPYERGAFKDNKKVIDLCAVNEKLDTYLKRCYNYYELGKYVFVHGWCPTVDFENWKIGNWEDARWINGMKYFMRGVVVPGKIVVCGHYHCSWGNCVYGDAKGEFDDFSPFVRYGTNGSGIVAFDACTTLSGKVNIIVINEEDI